MNTRLAFLYVIVIASLAAFGCGPADSGDGDGGNGDGDGGNGTIDASNLPQVDAYQQERNCSGDLQHVLDENGTILETCWPDQGCYEGQCVASCTAASNSQGNVGCDFMVSTPHFYVGIAPPCFAVFVANNWPSPANLTITRGGMTYDATTFGRIATSDANVGTWPAVPATGVAEGEVAVLFLSHDPASVNGTPLTCPVAPGIAATGGSAVTATGVGEAWSITSDVPISMYDILPFGGASSYLPSAELVLPTTAWGDEYVTVMPKPSSNGNGGPPWAQLVAHEDNTTIDIRPTIALPAGTGVAAAPANVVTQFTLDAGEYIQWQFGSEAEDMSGSVIDADKDVSFTGGNAYICYSSATSNGGGCDSAHQQIPPLAALGNEYVGAPFISRGNVPESLPYRVVGTVDGTTLAYDPPVAGAPTTLNLGQVVDFESNVPFAVTSQDEDHPFYVAQMMSGCLLMDGNPGCDGDEEFVNVLPPAQFLSKYVFFTDPSYPRTDLVFTRKTENGMGSAVNLACLGEVTGWTQIGTTEYETATVALLDSCTNGPHSASSDAPFGITVWGMASASSYAYPAGGNVSDINAVDIIIE
jgi:hypothetical protein